MPVPVEPKIYHIVHVDRLPSIVADGGLLCDADVASHASEGTTIGMNDIKERRRQLCLTSHRDLRVGECVPFYFCPRSVMLYVIRQANHPKLRYRGGQNPIVHLEADLRRTVTWAEEQELRWAFTLSNAGSYYFEDRCDLRQLDQIDWDAVNAVNWQHCKEGKQAEFLIERRFDWTLVSRIGVRSDEVSHEVGVVLEGDEGRPSVEVRPEWYY
ncbi:MAG: DUF4433 domain-containing protein [Acidobacteria bacterium]|nr:DUF4433 domain-containing protein [Acidobacteriota bacterium]